MGKFCIGVLIGFAACVAGVFWIYDLSNKDRNISEEESRLIYDLGDIAGHNRESVINVIGPDGEILKSVTFVRND